MITFDSGIDIRCREPATPEVARFAVGGGYRFIVIGTDYGHVHTTSGDVRTWQTKNGAARFMRQYVAARK